VYDASGRRIEKKYNNVTVLKYVYDGDHCIAEYDASDNLRRKYVYGPGVDQPISMTESSGTYAGTYYYHFDALGSVVALTNSSGNTVEVYEYDVYGRVGATDANHPNRFMFTGREFDKETGLYYYRARYYNPQIGRFLQTDPVGYKVAMNLYLYCKNNPAVWIDSSGRETGRYPGYGIIGDDPAKEKEYEEWDRAWGEALLLWVQFVTGTGAEYPKLGPDSAMVGQLKNDWRVEVARQGFRAMNTGKPRSEWVSYTAPTYSFELTDYVEYIMSPLHVLGSFSVTVSTGVTVSPGDDGPSDSNDRSQAEPETITVYNEMSWRSQWRILEKLDAGDAPMGESWTRAEFSFCGTTYQTFTWQENVLDEGE